MQREQGEIDMNGRPTSPGADGENGGSPSKRPRLEGQQFNAGMMPNGRPGMPGIGTSAPVDGAPQAAVLEVERIDRALLTLTLTCDRRVLDAAAASCFLAHVRDTLQQPVTLAYVEEGFAAVQGLAPGARVVVEGAQNLRPGSVVTEATPAVETGKGEAPKGGDNNNKKGGRRKSDEGKPA